MRTLFLLLLMAWIMVGCGGSRAIYGIPQAQWQRMSEAERQMAIEHFQQQEEINSHTRSQADQAKQAAKDFAQQCRESQEDSTRSNKCRVITQQRWLW